MSSIQDFTNWQDVNEQKLDIDSKSSKKQARKQKRKSNKRSNRKSTYLSDSGVEFALIKRKSDGDSTTDAYTLKSKNKDSKIWDAEGVITDDVDSFLQDELFGGTTEGKYDEESIELDKYKQGARKDNVKFTVKLVDKEAKKKKEADEAKKKKEASEAKKKADVAKKPADLYKAIVIPENDEGEKRIEIGQESTVLPEIKDILRKSYIKQGLKLPTKTFGVSWLDASKLEDIDSQWIKMLRAGFKMKSADYITQGFVKKMVDQANLWNKAPKATPKEEVKTEAPTEDVASNESSLFSFNGFVKVNEEFDMEAANAVVTKPKSEAPKKKKSSGGGSGSSGLTNDQATAYRTWANKFDKLKNDYGKTSKFDLDATGSNNSFVKRSYTQAKSDYDANTGHLKKKWSNGSENAWRKVFAKIVGLDEESVSPVDTNSSELRKSMQSDFDIANKISYKLTSFWSKSGGSTFKPFKGYVNDDEDAALAGGYLPWLKSSGINKLLASIVNPYYKKTMDGVIAKTKEEMTDSVGNDVSWSILDPAKTPNIADEGLIALSKHEPPASTWIGATWDRISGIASSLLGGKPHMKKFSIPGSKFDF
tara:strand:+ start:8572 stop:10350 length:1779 start_codon:yes stop_codon:yes gene_type:complete